MTSSWVASRQRRPSSSSPLGHLVQRLTYGLEHIVDLRRCNDQRWTKAHSFTDIACNHASFEGGVGNGERRIAWLGIRPWLDLQCADQADAARRMRDGVFGKLRQSR